MYREYHTKSPSSKRQRHRYKVAILKKYGNKCAYCGIDKYEVLVVDHINDDGKSDRERLKSLGFYQGMMWKYLSQVEYQPDKYQILCHNCNMAKYQYKIRPGGNESKPISWWDNFSKIRLQHKTGKVLSCSVCGEKKYYAPSNVAKLLLDGYVCKSCRSESHRNLIIKCSVCKKARNIYPSDKAKIATPYRCNLHRAGRRMKNAPLRKIHSFGIRGA